MSTPSPDHLVPPFQRQCGNTDCPTLPEFSDVVGWQPQAGTTPVPGLSPVFTPFDREHRDATFRYGRLRVISSYCREIEAELKYARELYATFMTHSLGTAGLALPVRHLSAARTRERSKTARREIRLIGHENGLMMLPYCQYQGHLGSSHNSGHPIYGTNWPSYLETWQHLIPPALWDDFENCIEWTREMRLSGRETSEVRETAAGLNCEARSFSLDAPITLARALGALAIDVANGAQGCYWDCGGYAGPEMGYSPYGIRGYRRWVADNLASDEQLALFGVMAEALEPPPMPASAELLCQDILHTPAELDVVLFPPEDPSHFPPELIAFMRYHRDHHACFMRRIRQYGESLIDGFVSVATYYVDNSGPHFYSFWNSGPELEGMVQRGNAHSTVLWESWNNAAHAGFARGEPRPPHLFARALTERNHDAYVYPEVYGRYSNTAFLKYATEVCLPLPLLYKCKPHNCPQEISDPAAAAAWQERLWLLLFAEAWANLAALRTHMFDEQPGVFRAARSMMGFQAHHEELFIGARRYDTVAVWCSLQQALVRRYDTALGVSRMLTDADIGHRVISDRAIDGNELDGLCCIIVANIRLMTDRQIQVLNTFGRRPGNSLVVVGRCADRDEWDRERPGGMAALRAGLDHSAFIHLDQRVYPRLAPQGAYRVEGYGGDLAPLARAVRQLHGQELTCGVRTPEHLEVHPLYIPAATGSDGRARLVVHLVNYSISYACRAFSGLDSFALPVRLPAGTRAATARLYTPFGWYGRHTDGGKPDPGLGIAVRQSPLPDGGSSAVVDVPPLADCGIICIDLDSGTDSNG